MVRILPENIRAKVALRPTPLKGTCRPAPALTFICVGFNLFSLLKWIYCLYLVNPGLFKSVQEVLTMCKTLFIHIAVAFRDFEVKEFI